MIFYHCVTIFRNVQSLGIVAREIRNLTLIHHATYKALIKLGELKEFFSVESNEETSEVHSQFYPFPPCLVSALFIC